MTRTYDEPGPRVDVDAKSAGVGLTVSTEISDDVYGERAADRRSNRELDELIQNSTGYRQNVRDAGSAFPRDATSGLAHPAMDRRVLELDARRTPISARQKRARSALKRAVQSMLSDAQHRELTRLLGAGGIAWGRLNDELSDALGNLQELRPATRRRVRRVDRAIQAYEARSGRGHVVYARVQLPAGVAARDAEAYLRLRLMAGDEIDLDRFTMTTHQMHEQERHSATDAGPSVLLEIHTRRGMYLGGSEGRDDTSHLLPRGWHGRVTSPPTETRFLRPDGSHGSAVVIQLTDD